MTKTAKRQKPLPNGRDDARINFTAVPHYLANEPAFQALSSHAAHLLLLIMLRYRGNNNGLIRFGHREAARRMGCATSTATKAFGSLRDHGFIQPAELGSFHWKGDGHPTEWILTMFGYLKDPPTKDFTRWVPPSGGGHEAPAPNPNRTAREDGEPGENREHGTVTQDAPSRRTVHPVHHAVRSPPNRTATQDGLAHFAPSTVPPDGTQYMYTREGGENGEPASPPDQRGLRLLRTVA